MLFICIILFILAKASKAEKKLCGFAFMRLTDDEDIVIKDAFHNLCIYKVSMLHWEAVGITLVILAVENIWRLTCVAVWGPK